MSTRTIIEINHDHVERIKIEPEFFARQMRLALQSNSNEAWSYLRMFGVTRIVEAHHSDERKVVVEGREYPVG